MAYLTYKDLRIDYRKILDPVKVSKSNEILPILWIIRNWQKGQNSFSLKTSGSTGKPRELHFKRSQVKTSAWQSINTFGLKPDDNLLLCLPTDHVAGFMMIIRALENNMNLTVVQPTADPFSALSKTCKIDFCAMVPYQLGHTLDHFTEYKGILNSMKAIIIGGGSIPSSMQKHLDQVPCPLYHTYGMTETLTHVAIKKLNQPYADKYFKALQGVSFSTDQNNCLRIQTPVVPDESIQTNDVVKLISQEQFEFLGRHDQVINSGGFKIHPEQLEKKIEKHIGKYFHSTNFFIYPVNDEQLGHRAELFIETDKKQADIITFREKVKKLLHKYEIPKKIHIIESFERTSIGKTDKLKTLEKTKKP